MEVIKPTLVSNVKRGFILIVSHKSDHAGNIITAITIVTPAIKVLVSYIRSV